MSRIQWFYCKHRYNCWVYAPQSMSSVNQTLSWPKCATVPLSCTRQMPTPLLSSLLLSACPYTLSNLIPKPNLSLTYFVQIPNTQTTPLLPQPLAHLLCPIKYPNQTYPLLTLTYFAQSNAESLAHIRRPITYPNQTSTLPVPLAHIRCPK